MQYGKVHMPQPIFKNIKIPYGLKGKLGMQYPTEYTLAVLAKTIMFMKLQDTI